MVFTTRKVVKISPSGSHRFSPPQKIVVNTTPGGFLFESKPAWPKAVGLKVAVRKIRGVSPDSAREWPDVAEFFPQGCRLPLVINLAGSRKVCESPWKAIAES